MHYFAMTTEDKAELLLQDYEVVGVGAARKKKLVANASGEHYVLVRNPIDFLPGSLEDCVEWLKPVRIVSAASFSSTAVLENYFQHLFPIGIRELGDISQKLLKDYLQEMPWSEGLCEDHFRYFPLFVRERFQREYYHEIFLWEWLKNSRTYLDFGRPLQNEKGVLRLNPSFTTLLILKSASSLQCEPGLYAFASHPGTGETVIRKLSPQDATLLDLLSEDRKFSPQQLFEMLCLENDQSYDQFLNRVDSLIQDAILEL